jgi:hypothetical protein
VEIIGIFGLLLLGKMDTLQRWDGIVRYTMQSELLLLVVRWIGGGVSLGRRLFVCSPVRSSELVGGDSAGECFEILSLNI